MEQETKNKSKRALAIAGIATLSAFALIGLFAIGALIGGCAEKKQADAHASEQVQTAQVRRREGADVAAAHPKGAPLVIPDDAENLLADGVGYRNAYFREVDLGQGLQLDCQIYDLTGLVGVRAVHIDAGTYFYRNNANLFYGCAVFSDSAYNDFKYAYENLAVSEGTFYLVPHGQYTNYLTLTEFYFSVPSGGWFLCGYFPFNWYGELYLVDALEIPATDVLTLGDDWNPTAWVSREAIGGYPVVHTTYTTEANASGAYVIVGWDNVAFKTANNSAVFTGLRVKYRWLWNGVKYTYGGQTHTYNWTTMANTGSYWLVPASVDYRDANGIWQRVANANQDWDGSAYVFTPRFNWVLPSYRVLSFLEYPDDPTHLPIFLYATGEAGTGEYPWQETPTLYGVSFAEWFGLSSWDSPVNDVGAGNAIGLISTAFSGMVPILGISIFPNITLGLLLFLPLIGGIIVLIIKAVSK